MFYESSRNDHGLKVDPFKALVVPRPIGWITTLDGQGRINLADVLQHFPLALGQLGFDAMQEERGFFQEPLLGIGAPQTSRSVRINSASAFEPGKTTTHARITREVAWRRAPANARATDES